MPPTNNFMRALLAAALALTFAPCAPRTRAQQPAADAQKKPAPQESPKQTTAQDEDVLQVTTELVQTAVTVVDKQGRFVGGLRREQFEMLLDGKPQPISFFEQVEAGTAAEQRHLAAARARAGAAPTVGAETTEHGRTVFLFVDDVHLSSTSFMQVRKTLTHYVDDVMGQNDQALLASTSGHLGFLQQLTDDKAVLRAAVSRLNFRPSVSNLTGNPPITVYQAIAVEERNDDQTFQYLVQETLRATPGLPQKMAESLVHSRTRVIAREASMTNRATLSTLEGLLRSSARLPGRKIVFFLSDGFLLQMQNSDDAEQVRRITDAAARSDAVVYGVDSHGLATDPYFEAANGQGDVSGRGMTVSHSTADLRAQQEPLRIISEETGGRAVVNTNDLDAGVEHAIEESSRYYLLAWRPESEANRGGKFRRVEVTVAGRPDLVVRLHKGYIVQDAKPAPKGDKPAAAAAPQGELRAALSATFPVRQLPLDLSVNFVDTPERGAVVTASASVPSYPLSFASAGEKRTAVVEMACVVYDAQGKPAANSQRRIEVSGADAATSQPQRDIAYNFQFDKLPPGLYQVRAAARDGESGHAGSASQWIEIPDLKKRKLALSSLLIGGAQESKPGQTEELEQLELYVAHKFPAASRLRFYTYVYNATRGAGGRDAPDVVVRVRLWNRDRVIIDAGERKVATDGVTDFARLAYGAEFNLATLPAGRYLLQVNVTDRLSKETAAQTTRFEIR